jgi:hypothetical protein
VVGRVVDVVDHEAGLVGMLPIDPRLFEVAGHG